MRHILLYLTVLLALNTGYFSNNNSATKENHNSIDTSKAIKFVADKLTKGIQEKEQKITESGFQDGDFYIEFNKDTPNPKKENREYYTIDRSSIKIGHLNKDEKLDFAIESTWGVHRGNAYGLEWHIFLQRNGEWEEIENEFGGGKFSDIENVLSIDGHKLKTEFYKLDKESYRHDDSAVIYSYRLRNKQLERIK